MFQRRIAVVLIAALTLPPCSVWATEHRAGPFPYEGLAAHYLVDGNQQLICDSCGRPTLLAAGSPVLTVAFRPTTEDLEAENTSDVKGEPTKTRTATDEPIATVYFKFSSAALSLEAKERIRKAVVSQPGPFVVQVDGFTCRIGSHLYNNKLSVKRARTVATYLRSLGVQVAGVEGLGERKPLGGQLKNDRRAVIRVTERILLDDTP